MIDRIVNIQTAKKLKELGFNEECEKFYVKEEYPHSNDGWHIVVSPPTKLRNCSTLVCAAPTQTMAMAWLRKYHKIDIVVSPRCDLVGNRAYTPIIYKYLPKPKPELLGENDKWENRWVMKEYYLEYADNKCVMPAFQYFAEFEDAAEEGIFFCLTNKNLLEKEPTCY